jgi:hypothetical protein
MRTVRRPVHAEAMPPPHPSPRRLSTYEPVHGAAHLRPQRLRAPPTPARAPRATATTGQNGRRAGRERRSRPAAPPRRCRRPRRGMSPRRRPRTRTCLDDGATWRGCRKRERLPSEALLRPATTVRTLRGPAAATRDTVRSEVSAWCCTAPAWQRPCQAPLWQPSPNDSRTSCKAALYPVSRARRRSARSWVPQSREGSSDR